MHEHKLRPHEDKLEPTSISEPCPTLMLWMTHRRTGTHYQGTTHTSSPGLREAEGGGLGKLELLQV